MSLPNEIEERLNDDAEDNSNILKRSRSSSTPFSSISSTTPSSNSINMRKRVRTSVYEVAANAAADGMTALGVSIEKTKQTKFDQCLTILNDMKEEGVISVNSYFNITSTLMGNKGYAALFSGMLPDLRMQWLMREGLLKE